MGLPTSIPLVGGNSSGPVRVISNEKLLKNELDAQKAENEQNVPQILGLARHVQDVWTANLQHRENSGVEDDMIRSLAQRRNSYDPTKLAAIRAHGGTEVFLGLTGVKCRAAEAWIADVMLSDRDKPWFLKPSPVPDLPPVVEQTIAERVLQEFQVRLQQADQPQMSTGEVFQLASAYRDEMDDQLSEEATERAHRMETKIDDQLKEGGWNEAFEDCITNLVTLKAGIIKGPILRRKKVLRHDKPLFGGKTITSVVTEIKHVYESVSPFDYYPQDGVSSIQNGDNIERIKYSRKDLVALKGLPNYNEDAIDLVLHRYGRGGIRSWTNLDQTRSRLEENGDDIIVTKDWIEGKEFWGSVSGQILTEEGILVDPDGKVLNPLHEYQINAIMIGSKIIYRTFNSDPLGRRPYSKSGWGKNPGSFWYDGVPDLMRDLQSICNASVRSLVNNMGIASGPQVVVNDITRLAKGETIKSMKPWKIWQFTNALHSNMKAIDFFQPNSNATELIGVYTHFARLADDFTGIPAYTYGNEKLSGAGRTASGLSMLMNSASRGIKKVIARIDAEILQDVLQRQYDWNMLNIDDESIKGDTNIQPQGALALIIKEQMAAQRIEFLNATANPFDQEIMGVEGRANVLREASSVLQMDTEEVVPDKGRIKGLAAQIEQQKAAEQQAQLQKQAA